MERVADGFKYNAVSCDACRVFFERQVRETEKPFNPAKERNCAVRLDHEIRRLECICGKLHWLHGPLPYPSIIRVV